MRSLIRFAGANDLRRRGDDYQSWHIFFTFIDICIYTQNPSRRNETRFSRLSFASLIPFSNWQQWHIWIYMYIHVWVCVCVCIYIYTHILSTDKQKATTAITGTLDERQKSFFDRWKKSWNSNILISNFQKFTCRFKK